MTLFGSDFTMTERPLNKNAVRALDRQIAYHERGTGAPILYSMAIRRPPISGATACPRLRGEAA